MTNDIDWEEILIRSNEFTKEILEHDGNYFDDSILPGNIIREFCKDALGRANPKNCYE